MTTQENPWMKISELSFDRKNPRLSEYDIDENSSEDEVIRVLWDAMDVWELVLSIAASGFFPHEPIIVAQEEMRNVVIEGNRRLAAVKLLLEPKLAEGFGKAIPIITPEAKNALRELPVLLNSREQAWRFLGFKHVNGPAKWSSYAKSQYIGDVHRNFEVPLEAIARQIGDTHNTVQRLFRGLMVIEQAERINVFDREDRYQRHFSFSHLYTGMGYDGIASFIGLRPETEENEEPVPIEKKNELGELCVWLYGSRKQDRRPLIGSQNPDLRLLDAIVANREAVAALRAGTELRLAYELSRPSSTVFEESLHAAKRNLEKVRALVSTAYDGSRELLGVAEDVADLAYDLYDEMRRKHDPPRERRTKRES